MAEALSAIERLKATQQKKTVVPKKPKVAEALSAIERLKVCIGLFPFVELMSGRSIERD